MDITKHFIKRRLKQKLRKGNVLRKKKVYQIWSKDKVGCPWTGQHDGYWDFEKIISKEW